MSLQQVFIRNLKSIRKNSGLSQMQLSLSCDASASYIGEIEIGRKFPSVGMIEKIASALRIPAHLLFWDEQSRYRTARIPPRIPDAIKQDFIDRLITTICQVVRKY